MGSSLVFDIHSTQLMNMKIKKDILGNCPVTKYEKIVARFGNPSSRNIKLCERYKLP